MKKLSFISILFLCVFVVISTAHSYPYEYVIDGTWEKTLANSDDSAGWDGKHYVVTLRVDSNATPFNTPSTGPISRYDVLNWEFDVDDGYFYREGPGASPTSIGFYNNEDVGGTIYDVFRFQITQSGYDMPYVYGGIYFPNTTFDHSADTVYPVQDLQFANVINGDVGMGSAFRAYNGTVESFSSQPVPEPTTMLLFGAGLVGLAGFGRKRFKK